MFKLPKYYISFARHSYLKMYIYGFDSLSPHLIFPEQMNERKEKEGHEKFGSQV